MTKTKVEAQHITVRFAGDSGDGMQLAGDQFTDTAALMGNDFSTLPDYPAEIRAPAGTLPGVSSFQVQFSESLIFTPGDYADVLIAMNAAALKVNLVNIKKNGLIIVNEDAFVDEKLKKAGWKSNPLLDDTLKGFTVLKVPLHKLTENALKEHHLRPTEIDRCKNFFGLGMAFWLYSRSLDHTIKWIEKKFSKKPEITKANIAVLKAGYNYADMLETMPIQYDVREAKLESGTYRKITGNEATAIGFIAAAQLANKTLFYGTYPITPASNILHELAKAKNFNVKTFQAEDEISACGAALGASYGGELAITGTSGPGLCLKSEAINLAVMTELPLIIINVQRAGPSTGMPTKTEQADLLQALYGRNGESPLAVVAPLSASDCFYMAIEAARLAIKYMTPVIFLSEANIANAAEPWKLPRIDELPKISLTHPNTNGKPFFPYGRDPKTLGRPWIIPGTKGMEHRIGGLSKADRTGNVSYDPDNNQKMVMLRREKIQRIENDIPEAEVEGPPDGPLLILGWGGTYGAIYQAIQDLKNEGTLVSHLHLKYISPFPKNLGEILKKFHKILIPELNMGQLLLLIRGTFPGTNALGFPKVQGQPFKSIEIVEKVKQIL